MMRRVAFFLLTSTPLTAFGGGPYEQLTPCGSAQVVSGSTCTDLKVEFKFDGCALTSAPQEATKMICDGKNPVARFENESYRYDAELEKVSDDWGANQWQLVGGVKQFKVQAKKSPDDEPEVERKNPPKEKPHAVRVPKLIRIPPVVPVAPVLSAPPAAPPVAATPAAAPTQEPAAASPFKFSAFFDFGYTILNAARDPAVANSHAESGFGIQDGNVAVNYQKGNVAVISDFAFRRMKDFDTSSSAPVPNESSTNNFAIGIDKSQLYLKYKLIDELYADVGQFDTIFGVEVNDSKDRVFEQTGLLYNTTLPLTHTGAMLEYSTHGAYVKAFAANPNNRGSYGTSTIGDNNTEFGSALGYSNDYVRGQIGVMTRPVNRADESGRELRDLIDATVGGTYGPASVDLELALVSDPGKNSLTPDNLTDREKAGKVFMALASYKVTDNLLAGLRYESLTSDPAASSIKAADSYGLCVHYTLTPEVQLRAEHVKTHFTGTLENRWTNSRSTLAAIVGF